MPEKISKKTLEMMMPDPAFQSVFLAGAATAIEDAGKAINLVFVSENIHFMFFILAAQVVLPLLIMFLTTTKNIIFSTTYNQIFNTSKVIIFRQPKNSECRLSQPF